MTGLALVLALTSSPAAGEARVTIDGETTTYSLAACSTASEGGMPDRILIEEMDLLVNASQADHMQMISVIKNNENWAASRLFNEGEWTDRGEPGKPIVIEWGETIRIEASLSSAQAEGEKNVRIHARCS